MRRRRRGFIFLSIFCFFVLFCSSFLSAVAPTSLSYILISSATNEPLLIIYQMEIDPKPLLLCWITDGLILIIIISGRLQFKNQLMRAN